MTLVTLQPHRFSPEHGMDGAIIGHAFDQLLPCGHWCHRIQTAAWRRGVKKTLTRLLGVAFGQREPARRVPRLKDIAPIRNHLLRTIEDCMSQQAHRLRAQIEGAASPQELWLLRNDAFQLISQQHSQQVAAQRIDSLISVFEGWLDPKQLARIR